MEKLILIDGNSLINRAFYAIPSLVTKDGKDVNGVYGFINMLVKLIVEESPDYIAVAFDVHAPTFRHKMFDDYKGTRKPMPEALRPQIPLLKEVLNKMGVYTSELAGFEADDIIGTIAKSTAVKTLIVTGDRDSFQLVDENTSVLFTKRGITDTDLYSVENFEQKTEITPKQIIDLKALMGDASDNIPGVPGVGEKTAKDLIKKYHSIDGVYQNIQEITGKLQEKLISGKDLCYTSKTLATINVNVPIDCNLENMRVKIPFSNDVKALFTELEFKTLLKKDELFAGVTVTKKEQVEVKQILSVNDLKDIGLKDKISVVIDSGVHLYFGDNVEYFVKVKENFFEEGVSFEELTGLLREIFVSNKNLIVYDKKELRRTLKGYGIDFTANADDVMLAKYLVNYGAKDDLNSVIEEYGYLSDAPSYALYQIFNELQDKLKIEDEYLLYKDVELPLADVLFFMEEDGFKVDINSINILKEKYSVELKVLEEDIFKLAGERFNVNSPKQLGVILFEKLNIKAAKKTKTGYSTSADVLEPLADNYPIIALILKYRQKQKLLSTYIEGFIPLIDKATGLIHTKFNQAVTTTGRLSSSEPNLQNLPIRDDEGKEIRKFFVPRDDEHVLVGADYSQIELRLLAHFSGCKELVDAYNKGEDIHKITASTVFGVPLNQVTEHMRRSAKAVNFGIIYGISDFGLGKNLNVPTKKAGEYIKAYFEKYSAVSEYMQSNVEFAKQNGYVSTLLGRRRYIREINSANYLQKSFGERAAMNMPLQGSSADIIKLAMINVFNRLKKEGLKSKLILQVHDELIVDAYYTEEEKVKQILKEEMENVYKLKVPLTVSVGAGKTLFDAK